MAIREAPEMTVITQGPMIVTSQGAGGAKARETWGGKVEFLLSAVGFAVGLGNVWRFPHLCYKNGGGAFLIPYSIMMVLAGLPLFYMELAWGQYASLGPITIWRCVPLFKGVGYTMVTVSLLVSVYYNVIIGYTLYYFFASFTSELPWSHCNNTWNTPACVEIQYHGDYILNGTDNSTASGGSFNVSTVEVHSSVGEHVASPAEEYWEYHVLGLNSNITIGNLGSLQPNVCLCLMLAWIVVFLCILQGIKSSGKVVYFTATFPYVVLLILLLRGVTLPGAGKGISFYLMPDFSKMAHARVWSDAAVQILYSLGPGFGSLLTMGSYNKFNNNCCKDAITVVLINCGTSVFAGFVIFSVLGFMSEVSGLPVSQVAKSGPGLAFIAYPEALAMMPGAPFWSVIFFFMLFTLGLDSQFAGMECIMTGIVDEFPHLLKYKRWLTGGVCGLLCIFGLPCVTKGGIYVFELLDKYATTVPLLVLTATETLVLSWIYGWRRFACDLDAMMGKKPNYYWIGCWMAVSPAIILLILIFYCIEYDGMHYDDYRYPQWAEAIGWLIVVTVLTQIPVWMIIKCYQKVGSCKDLVMTIFGPSSLRSIRLGSLLIPDERWGPAHDADRHKQTPKLEKLKSHNVKYSVEADEVRIVSNEEETPEQNGNPEQRNGMIEPASNAGDINKEKERTDEKSHFVSLAPSTNYTSPGDSYI